MRARPVTENITMLTRMAVINAYLVREDDGLTLIDTMTKKSGQGLFAAARNAGAPIVRILLTHGHPDHAGSVDEVVGLVPGVEYISSERESRLNAGRIENEPGEQGKLRPSGFPKVEAAPARTVVEGDRIGSLEVIAAPGHTPGQIALLDTRDRTLICGDAFSNVLGLSHTGRVHPGFPLPGFVTWNRELAAATARKLAALEPDRIAFGHGDPIDRPGERLRKAAP